MDGLGRISQNPFSTIPRNAGSSPNRCQELIEQLSVPMSIDSEPQQEVSSGQVGSRWARDVRRLSLKMPSLRAFLITQRISSTAEISEFCWTTTEWRYSSYPLPYSISMHYLIGDCHATSKSPSVFGFPLPSRPAAPYA